MVPVSCVCFFLLWTVTCAHLSSSHHLVATSPHAQHLHSPTARNLSTSPGWVIPSQLSALVWMALWAKENKFGSPLDPIYVLSVHRSEPLLSHGSFVLSVEDSYSCSLHCLALTSWANPSLLSIPRLGLALRCIPGFPLARTHVW